MKKVDDHLYYGPAPSNRTIPLREVLETCNVLVNCRERSETSHWYFHEKGESMDEIHEGNEEDDNETVRKRFIGCPTPSRGLADKEQVERVCRKIVEEIRNHESVVYVHCRDGYSECGVIVCVCMYWLENRVDYDPVHELRLQNEYMLCNSKEQRKQATDLYPFAKKMNYWNQWSNKSRKL